MIGRLRSAMFDNFGRHADSHGILLDIAVHNRARADHGLALARLEQALGISETEIGIIQDALLSQPNLAEDTFSYRQLKDLLADDWPTGVLHCVRQAILATA